MSIRSLVGRPYPAPTRALTVYGAQQIFVPQDVGPIAERVQQSVLSGKETAMVERLNEAALEYFCAARRDRSGNASEFEEWASRVADASAKFLNALGLSEGLAPNATFPLGSYAALCSRSGSSLTHRRYPNGFDYLHALEGAAMGAAVAHDLATHAAAYYAANKASPQDAARKGLSSRQRFILHLARAYEDCFGKKVPKNPQAGASPFLRFVMRVFRIVEERMVPPAAPITQPNDGADYEAAKLLAHASESKIADDLKKRVFDLIALSTDQVGNLSPGKIIVRKAGR